VTTTRSPKVADPEVPVTSGFAPWVAWPEVKSMLDVEWDPENSPHHSIIGLTGSGKSFLAINGILKPLCPMDRVLIIDCKRNDKLVASVGKPCIELPPKTFYTRKREPYDSWHRLVVHDQFTPEGRDKAKLQVFKAMYQLYKEGNWVMYCDEVQDIGGIRQPNLGLTMHLDEFYRKGRAHNLPVLAGTQAPRWVPASFYDQASFHWIGRLADEDKQKRLREIGGMPKEAFPAVSALQRRQWLLCANNGEEFLRTKVTV
jgi:hypothetical protein